MTRSRFSAVGLVVLVLGLSSAPSAGRAQSDWGSSFDYGATDEGDSGSTAATPDASSDTNDGSEPEAIPVDAEPDTGLEDEPAAVRAEMWWGLGVGTRSLRYPTPLGPSTTDTGAFTAVDLGVELAFRRKAKRSFGLVAAYRTSAGLHVDEARVAATPRTYRARSHQLRAGLFVRRSMGERGSLTSTFGYAMRNFHSLVPDVQTPSFTLSGPLLSLGFEIHSSARRFWLRLEPEVTPILQVGDQATARGAARGGLAGGGEAVVGVRLLDRLGCEFVYYESRARVGSGENILRDGMRFITLRLRGEL